MAVGGLRIILNDPSQCLNSFENNSQSTSLYQDRKYWRIRYFDEKESKGKDEYFGEDKATALAHAMAICDIKVEKWQKRKQVYFEEYKRLMNRTAEEIPE